MSQPVPASAVASKSAPTAAADAPIGIGVRLGHAVLPEDATVSMLRAAIELSNSKFWWPGLANELNPSIIDVDKALALLAAVPSLPKKTRNRLAGLQLSLNHRDLQVSSAAPTTAASFAKPFALEIVEVRDKTLAARTTVPVVPELARERAKAAQQQLSAESKTIESLEALRLAEPQLGDPQRKTVQELTAARWRRSALVSSWRANAELLSKQPGASAADTAQSAAANQAFKAYHLLGGYGMPGSRRELKASFYLAEGYADKQGQARAELLTTFAAATAALFLHALLSPQELTLTHEALQQALLKHTGAPSSRAQGALGEALETARGTIKQPNHKALGEWLTECTQAVKTDADLQAFLEHVSAVSRKYAVILAAGSPLNWR
jgi:hypothetical protein